MHEKGVKEGGFNKITLSPTKINYDGDVGTDVIILDKSPLKIKKLNNAANTTLKRLSPRSSPQGSKTTLRKLDAGKEKAKIKVKPRAKSQLREIKKINLNIESEGQKPAMKLVNDFAAPEEKSKPLVIKRRLNKVSKDGDNNKKSQKLILSTLDERPVEKLSKTALGFHNDSTPALEVKNMIKPPTNVIETATVSLTPHSLP